MFWEVHFADAVKEDIFAFFALGAANYFAEVWGQDVHGADGFVVVVYFHVEGLNFFWVVDDYGRAFDEFVGKEAFVFRLEVDAPGDWEFEFLSGFL